MPQISATNLVKTYQRRTHAGGWRGTLGGLFSTQTTAVRAVDGLSFQIAAGELVAFLGPNGAGKSTVIKMLVGILVPDGGSCEVAGLQPSRDRRRHVDRIGVVFGQRSQLWWDLPVRDTFALLRTVYDRDAALWRASCKELVEILGLAQLLERPVRQLSLGERMRCELAAALMHRPEILFLDEPTIGLDASAKLAVRSCLQRINRDRGVTILLTTHDLDDVEALAQRVLVINSGKLLLDGGLTRLREAGGHTRLVRIEAADDITVAARPGLEIVRQDHGHVEVRVDIRRTGIAEVVRDLLANGTVIDLQVVPPPIEELVAALYEQLGLSMASSIIKTVAPYMQHTSTCLRAALTYRVAAISGALTQIAYGCIRVEILEACYRTGAQATSLTLSAAQDYIWLGQAFLRIVPMRPDEDLTEAMRSGTLAHDLVRPLDAYCWWLSRSVGRCTAQVVLRALPLLLIVVLLGGLHAPQGLGAALACLLCTVCAILVGCSLRILITLLGDWNTGSNAIAPLLFPVIWCLCGIVVPLPLMPHGFQELIAMLPFRALLDTPLRAWSGDLAGSSLLLALLHQLAWLLLLMGLSQALARRGLSTLSLQGG